MKVDDVAAESEQTATWRLGRSGFCSWAPVTLRANPNPPGGGGPGGGR